MPQPAQADVEGRLATGARQTLSMVASLVPLIVGIALLTGLLLEFLPVGSIAEWLGRSELMDALTGALAGSLAIGNPVASYVLGGELVERGISLMAVTAFLVSWVTVGSIQLPAEMLMLGKRFAVYRNLICFGLALLAAPLIVATARLLG